MRTLYYELAVQYPILGFSVTTNPTDLTALDNLGSKGLSKYLYTLIHEIINLKND